MKVSGRGMPAWDRPLRIPARVPLCHSRPEYALAAERSTWELLFRSADDVPAGAALTRCVAL